MIGKKGMETWQLVLLVLGLLLMILLMAWYGGLGRQMSDLLEKFGRML